MVRFKHRYLLISLVFPTTLSNPLSIPSPSSTAPLPSNSTSVLVGNKRPEVPTLTEKAIVGLLRESLSVNFGDVGAGEVGGSFQIKYLSPHTNLVIIRVSREHFRTLWAALTLLRKLAGEEVIARVLHVSGTIRKTQHAAIAFDREQILLAASRRGSSIIPSVIGAPSTVDTKVEEQLRLSEATIMATEA